MKLKATFATEAYICQGGYFAIKQEAPYGEDDNVVLLSPAQMRLIITEMQGFLEDESWFQEIEVEG